MLARKVKGDSLRLVRVLNLRGKSAFINYFKFGSFYRLEIQNCTFQWNYSVLFTPENTGGYRHML